MSVYQDIRRLLTLAFPGPSTETTEIIGRDSFLDSLSDQELALKIREREVKTLEDALYVATRLQAYVLPRLQEDLSNVRTHIPRNARGTIVNDDHQQGSDDSVTWLVQQMTLLNQKVDSLMTSPNRQQHTTAIQTNTHQTLPTLASTSLQSTVTPLMTIKCQPTASIAKSSPSKDQARSKQKGPCYVCHQIGHLAQTLPTGGLSQHFNLSHHDEKMVRILNVQKIMYT